ncbi:dTDP-4-dehydrorhamnose 3,5-epimerase [Prochlorococcus marinus]|uniref:dTDP-4-dehydrorhamnose 3,5-epimerase n=1 Tax=Prochlorococcus marinus str. PAC1 TaxID=59924 RepID=A0A0A2C6D1_PROMR|nr:dTDP-4-dehydrorhamnose 3,5-epimerase [Prochlorococcus marinus]KGG21893.1 dTDP-4-dehydrorhamnose 3,5-epimerase [Prochlorococcus marinus str. PAC1]
MKVDIQAIEGPLLFRPQLIKDSRGFFYESWNQALFNKLLESHKQPPVTFVQDNHSKSNKGVLRGLHYQLEPNPQGKLVRCISGKIFDVAVDLRKDSKNFMRWISVILSSNNNAQLWIPKGFAHGFVAMSENVEVLYKVTHYWNKQAERSINCSDNQLNINWPILENIERSISKKDSEAPMIADLSSKDFF